MYLLLWINICAIFIIRYELHAMRLEKLKQIAIENKKDSNKSAYEVEMLEARKPTNLEPATSLE